MPLNRRRMQQITPDEHYRRIEFVHQQVSREMMACGTHVHVGSADRDAAVAVLNRSRGYLPTLLALSANSPFWDGTDTRFASYRTGAVRLFNPVTCELLPAATLLDAVLDDLRPAFEADGGSRRVGLRLLRMAVNAPTGP